MLRSYRISLICIVITLATSGKLWFELIFIESVFKISFLTVHSKCYECNTEVGGDCGHNFNPRTALEVNCGKSVGVSAVSVSVPGSTQHFTSVKNSTGCLKAVVGDREYYIF